jgi:hypothetical protein
MGSSDRALLTRSFVGLPSTLTNGLTDGENAVTELS